MARRGGEIGNLLVQMRMEMGQLKTDIREMQSTFDRGFAGIKSSAVSLGRSLTGVFTIGAVVAFGKNIADLAGKFQDLHEQTGLSVELLSGVRGLLEDSGVSVEQFAKGVLFAQKNLGAMDEDSGRAAAALKALGLNVKELIQLSPDQFLEKFSNALAGVANQNQRTAIATAVMGKAGAELVPVVVKMAGEFENLRNRGLNADTVKAIDDTTEALTRLRRRTVDLTFSGIGNLFKDLGIISKSLNELQRELDETLRNAPGDIAKIQRLQKELLDTRDRIDRQDITKGRPTGLLDLGDDDARKKKAQEFVKSLERQVTTLKAQTVELNQGKEAALNFAIGQLEIEAKAHGATQRMRDLIAQIHQLKSEIGEGDIAERTLRAVGDTRDQIGTAADYFGSDQMRVDIAKMEKDSVEAAARINEIFSDVSKQGMSELERKIFDNTEHFARLRAEVLSTGESMGLTAEGVQHLIEQLQRAEEIQFGKIMQDEAQKASQAMQDAFQRAGNSITNIIETFTRAGKINVGTIIQEVFNLIALLQKANAVGLPGGGGLGGFFGAIGSVVGGIGKLFGFQHGGIVTRPTLGMLAEHGQPEAVIPLDKMRNLGVTNVYNIDARGAERGVHRDIKRMLEETKREAVQESLAVVTDTRRRSGNFARTFK